MTTHDLTELKLSDRDALFLDLDGSLADIRPDPDDVALDDETQEALRRLCRCLGGAVVILSGRDLRDLASRTPSELWRAGGHGLEVIAPGEAAPPPPSPPVDEIMMSLRAAADHPGVRLELKGPVAALHFRAAPEAQDACHAAAREAAAAVPDHVWQPGKMVVEVKPAHAHKGRTLRRLNAMPPFAGRRPIMIGDDTTDEDAIVDAQDLGGLGVKVGPGDSTAQLRTPDPTALRAWIAREADRLG